VLAACCSSPSKTRPGSPDRIEDLSSLLRSLGERDERLMVRPGVATRPDMASDQPPGEIGDRKPQGGGIEVTTDFR
jgi:hypothetical protein